MNNAQVERLVRRLHASGESLGGRWSVSARIGGGAQGEVWRGHHNGMGAAVAIKFVCLPLDPKSRVAVRERARRAALAGMQIRHEGIPVVHDLGEVDDIIFCVMDLVEGESLKTRLKRGVVQPDVAANIAYQLAVTAEACHRAGVVHRDIKPDNIMLVRCSTETLRVKLLDFGVASLPQQPRLTAPGTLVGTPYYMAPEQITDARSVDERSDVFTIGAVAFHMLAGKPIRYDAQDITDVYRDAFAGRPMPRVEDHVSEVDARLATVVNTALMLNPGYRHPSAAALADALQEAMALKTVPAPNSWLLRARASVMVATTCIVGFAVAGAAANGVGLAAPEMARQSDSLYVPQLPEPTKQEAPLAPRPEATSDPSALVSSAPEAPLPSKLPDGVINANSIPPSYVIIDGRPRGSTPVTGVAAAPGQHRVVFYHRRYGATNKTVVVGPGKTVTVTTRFRSRAAASQQPEMVYPDD